MRTAIFDLDGTLADTSGDLIAAANAALNQLGSEIELDPERDAGTAIRGGRAMLKLALSRLGRAEEEDTIDRGYPVLLDAYAQAIDVHTTLYPGAMTAIETLRMDGFAIGICTNKPVDLADLLLTRLGVRDDFHSLVGAGSLAVRKPDPAPLFAAIDRAGGGRDRAFLVGDTITDRDTARNAGVPCVLVTFGPEGRSVAELDPDALLARYDELPDLARRLVGQTPA